MATGDSLLEFFPADNEPPSSNYATLDTRNGTPVLDFDADTEEGALFSGFLPSTYGGGGLTAELLWSASSATSGDVKWGASIERHQVGTDDLDTDSFATEQTATGTVNATSGATTKTSIAFTSGANMDSLAAGERFRLKVHRKAADAADTMTGDCELVGILLKET